MILYENEGWCLTEGEMGILRMMERSIVRAICGEQLKEKEKRARDLMLMLVLNETIDHVIC